MMQVFPREPHVRGNEDEKEKEEEIGETIVNHFCVSRVWNCEPSKTGSRRIL